MAAFLVYWLPSYADAGAREKWRLDFLGTFHFRRIEAGDVVFLVTARQGRLSLIGRIEAARVLDPAQAAREIPEEERWGNSYVAVAKRGTASVMTDVPVPFPLVVALRFAGTERDRLDVGEARVFPQQLQTMRKLTPASARALERLWRTRQKLRR